MTTIRPRKGWLHERLLLAYPDCRVDAAEFRDRVEVRPGITVEFFAAKVDGPRMSATVVAHPDGDKRLTGKQVKREPAERSGRAHLLSMGIGSPHLVDAQYTNEKWRFSCASAEGRFEVACDEKGCQAPELGLGKGEAIQRAQSLLATLSVQQPALQETVHRGGRWRLDFRHPQVDFRLHIGPDQSCLVAQTLTESGSMAFTARHAGGKARSIRKSVLGLGRYWVVEVGTAAGTQRIKIDASGQIP